MTNTVSNGVKQRLDTPDDQLSERAVADAVVSLLDSRANQLTEAQLLRLTQARSLAVGRLQASSVVVQGNTLQWLGAQIGDLLAKHRAMSAVSGLGLAMMVLVLVQQLNSYEHLESSDAFLLASELPPEAFADKGFDTWLEAKANF